MKPVFRRLSFLLVLLALLAGVCSVLWPHNFADLQPECDSITLIRTDTAEDYSLTQTREIYSAELQWKSQTKFSKARSLLYSTKQKTACTR